MHFISMVTDVNNHSSNWMWNHYNLYYVPTIYFDGGHSVIVGGDYESEYRTAIELAGAREVTTLGLQVSVEWLGDAVIGIHVMLKQGIVCVDSDGDGFGDPGHAENECPVDNCPDISNSSQKDMDDDGLGDLCDPDTDGDGIINVDDNCWLVHNPLQENSDTDSVGDSCDNCQYVDNSYQYDDDGDGFGDVCDEDILYIQCCLDMPGTYLDVPFSYQFWAIGGEPPYQWIKGTGQYPYGLSMTSEGVLSGIPTWKATSVFQLIVEDQLEEVDTMLVTIEVVDQPPQQYICGDADGSEIVDIDDVVYLIQYIFAGGPAPEALESGDADCSGEIDIDDVVYIIQYIFAGGTAPCDPDGNEIPDC